KTEVRFQDAAAVRRLLVGGLQRALAGQGGRSSSSLAGIVLRQFSADSSHVQPRAGGYQYLPRDHSRPWSPELAETVETYHAPLEAGPQARVEPAETPPAGTGAESWPLGAARAQLHENYIIAQTGDGLVIV